MQTKEKQIRDREKTKGMRAQKAPKTNHDDFD